MTDIQQQQQVHIFQEQTSSLVGASNSETDQEINYQLCMARKADKSQCTHRKKWGDYCGVHYNKPNIKRIDEEFTPLNKKKKIRISKIIENSANNKIDKNFKYAIELGARNIDKVVKIQKVYKGWIVRHLNKMRGPALFRRNLCNNREDVYLFEPIENIHMNDFYSLLDEDGFIYGFHIESIYKYIECAKNKKEIMNPYNKNLLTDQTIKTIEKLYNYCNKLGIHNKINNELPIDEKFQIRNKVLNVFQKMDDLNNYTDIEWFLGLTHMQLFKLLYSIKDLFEYRMELSPTKKYSIIRNGHVFIKNNSFYKHLTFNSLRNEMIDEFDRLVSEGQTRDDKYLGSLVILSGIVEMVPSCSLAYPWLIQGTFGHV